MSDNYASLRRAFDAAYEQASGGKGKERHACGEPFERQTICILSRKHGVGFATGQAAKKAEESHRLLELRGAGAARAELLGAMVYLAAAWLRLGEVEDEEREALGR